MNKTELQQHIRSRTKTDTAQTNNWLKNRSISEHDVFNAEVLLLQAKKVAHELLLHHVALISRHKTEWLQDFARRCKSKRQSQRITNKECHAVLNYAKTVNREVFKQNRQAQQ